MWYIPQTIAIFQINRLTPLRSLRLEEIHLNKSDISPTELMSRGKIASEIFSNYDSKKCDKKAN